MLESYYAGAYWGVRPETASECAEHALLFFEKLTRIDPSWQQWCRAGKRPRGAPPLKANVSDKQELEELFRRGRNRANVRKEVDEELGFYITVWTPEKNYTMVRIHGGVYTPFISNVCVITFPSEGASAERILRMSVMKQVLMCMTMAWDPEWAVVTSGDVRDLVLQREKNEDAIGWLMYCSNRRGRVPPLPAPARIERVQDKGTLITLSEERFTASNPEHVARAVRIHELLARAGLLQSRREEPASNP